MLGSIAPSRCNNKLHPSFPVRSSGRRCVAHVGTSPVVASSASAVPFLPDYELVRGSQVPTTGGQPHTAVLIHGIMGSRTNLTSFAKVLSAALPTWQLLLVDLRCHGRSAATAAPAPHTIDSAAADLLRLFESLRIYPSALIGHCFGGKVALSAIRQVGMALPRRLQVWILDLPPGCVRCDATDHPSDVLNLVRSIPTPIASRKALLEAFAAKGFSLSSAQFMTTNLIPVPAGPAGPGTPAAGALTWRFDPESICELYRSFDSGDLWAQIEQGALPTGAGLHFVRAERSPFDWGGAPEGKRVQAAGATVHELKGSGHWVHIDNPEGLATIMAAELAHV